MRLAILSLSLATTALAQGVVPPYVLSQANPHPSLSAGGVPATAIEQVHMVHLAGDPPNVFLCGLTGRNLGAGLGGAGSGDLLLGKYDAVADTFTANTDAAALNSSAYEFGLTLHHTGLYATFDNYTTRTAWLASRPNLTSPFAVVGQITGLPSQSYYDPVLAEYQGTTHLLYVLGQRIAMQPIDLTTGALTGTATFVVDGAISGSTPNSPTPVIDSNGEIIGLSHHDLSSSDNDHFMSLDLDSNTPSVLLNDTTTWTNNGGFAGGRFVDAESSPAPYHALSLDTIWFTGGRAVNGSTMEVRAYVPPTSSTNIYVSYLLASVQYLPVPTSFPGINGKLGISPAVLIGVLIGQHNNANGEAMLAINVPADPALAGIKMPCQSLTIDVVGGAMTFGNTAALTVQ